MPVTQKKKCIQLGELVYQQQLAEQQIGSGKGIGVALRVGEGLICDTKKVDSRCSPGKNQNYVPLKPNTTSRYWRFTCSLWVQGLVPVEGKGGLYCSHVCCSVILNRSAVQHYDKCEVPIWPQMSHTFMTTTF